MAFHAVVDVDLLFGVQPRHFVLKYAHTHGVRGARDVTVSAHIGAIGGLLLLTVVTVVR